MKDEREREEGTKGKRRGKEKEKRKSEKINQFYTTKETFK